MSTAQFRTAPSLYIPINLVVAALLFTVVEVVAAALLYASDADLFARVAARHLLIGHGGQTKSLGPGEWARRDPIPFDPWTLWRNSHGNVFWGLKTDQLGYVLNDEHQQSAIDLAAEKRIFIVGGSSVAGTGASSNTTTIAAQLEKLLEARTGKSYNVVNAGVGGWSLQNEVAWFIHYIAPYTKPDLVVFLDGNNDSFRAISAAAFKSPYQTPATVLNFDPTVEKRAATLRLAETGSARRPASAWLAKDRLFILALILGREDDDESEQATPKDVKLPSPCNTPRISLEYFARYQESVLGAAKEAGIPVLFALQPTIAFKTNLTPEEADQLARIQWQFNENKNPYLNGEKNVCYLEFQKSYFTEAERLLARHAEQTKGETGARFVSLAHLFRDESGHMFFNSSHYTDNGNAAIARALADLIVPAKG